MIIFLKIVSILLFAGAIAIPAIVNYVRSENSYTDSYKRVSKGWTIAALSAAMVLFVFSCSIAIIPTGYTGVRTTFGQIDKAVMQNGFSWKIPFVQSVRMVNNKQQDVIFQGSQIWSETESRTAIYYEGVTVTYQINAEKSAWIYANVANYKDALVSSDLTASAIKSSSKCLSDTEATNRAVVEPLIMKNLQKSIDEKYGESVVLVNKVIVSNIDFEDSYNAAIAAKQQAQLSAEQQAIENQRAIDKAEADAEVKRKTSQAEADAKMITARAEADAKLIAAQAESEANALLEESLTCQILQAMYIEKWNGQLPNVFTGSDGTSIMVQPNS